MEGLTDRLRALHAATWDDTVDLVRLAPGTVPGVDVSGLGLHVVRETALGAHLDLRDGRVDRAVAALRAVLANQYAAPGRPWDGTFRVTAEQADPPGDDAVEWLHYDPNWRQFLGVILAVVVEDHEADLPADLVDALVAAIGRAVDGEPPERIPPWYTNPNLLHAWLQAWAGRRLGRPELVDAGRTRARMVMDRLEADGDVDEYNSPTYDGIDLWAAGLWCELPPASEFTAWGHRLIDVIAGRVSVLHHPTLGVMCGPHIRAYGLDPTRHVSLVGLWLALAGRPVEAVLPPVLDQHTVHVHDLHLLPMFERVAAPVLARLHLDGGFPRRHEQAFGPVVASSLLTTRAALGAERGRVAEFARDQYVPITAHVADDDGVLRWVGVKLGDRTTRIDAELVGGTVVAVVVTDGPGGVDVRLLTSDPPTGEGAQLRVGAISVAFDAEPIDRSSRGTPGGHVTELGFSAAAVGVVIDGGAAAG